MEQLQEEVASVLETLKRERKIYLNYVSDDAIKAGISITRIMQNVDDEIKNVVLELLKKELPYESPYMTVWWYSVFIGLKKDKDIFHEFIQYVRKNTGSFSVNTQYFLFYQLMAQRFRFNSLDMQDNKIKLWLFYMEIMEHFAGKMQTSLDMIPKEERDENLVLVITEQFLDERHGPTKTALDRCKALMTVQGKKVILINDSEVMSTIGAVPYYESYVNNYNSELLSEETQQWKGVTIPYFQCENNMPDIETVDYLLSEVRKMAPGRIILIGKGGVFGQLAGRLVPTLTVGLCPSELEYTTTKYQAPGKKLSEDDMNQLSKVGLSKNHVIESCFTYSLKEQTEAISRKELGLPEGAFILCVVGARLDNEVSEEFLEMLEKVFMDDMFLVFWGIFEQYETKIQKFSRLKAKSAFLGFCDDILSRLENCDLFVNPIRRGGGGGGVEALFKGVPVVTVNTGDVAINVGEEFCVQNYREMQKKILQYHDDKVFYQEMSDKARRRAEALFDTETEFINILHEMDRREENEAIA